MAKRSTPRRPTRKSASDGVDTPAAEASDRATSATSETSAADQPSELTYDDIAARAYDLWVRRGHASGGEFQDWLQAEKELRDERRRR